MKCILPKIIFITVSLACSTLLVKAQQLDTSSRSLPHLEEFVYPFKNMNFISPRFDRINFNDGSFYNTYYIRSVYTPLKAPVHIRFELPVATTNTSGKTVTGLDDISLRAVYVLGKVRRWFNGVGMKLIMPTSTDASIGAGAWQLQPAYGIVNIFPGDKGSFTLSADYRFSVGGNKYNNPGISVFGIAPNVDYWADKFYIGYYPTYTYNFKTSIWSFPFDIEAGYLFLKNWWISAEYIVPMEKNKPFKNEFGIKLRYNVLQGRKTG